MMKIDRVDLDDYIIIEFEMLKKYIDQQDIYDKNHRHKIDKEIKKTLEVVIFLIFETHVGKPADLTLSKRMEQNLLDIRNIFNNIIGKDFQRDLSIGFHDPVIPGTCTANLMWQLTGNSEARCVDITTNIS